MVSWLWIIESVLTASRWPVVAAKYCSSVQVYSYLGCGFISHYRLAGIVLLLVTSSQAAVL